MPIVRERLKRAEPTYEDVMTARWIGMDHPYWSETIHKNGSPATRNGATDDTQEAKDYRKLLEILACRERQLGVAISMLSEREREVVGA